VGRALEYPTLHGRTLRPCGQARPSSAAAMVRSSRTSTSGRPPACRHQPPIMASWSETAGSPIPRRSAFGPIAERAWSSRPSRSSTWGPRVRGRTAAGSQQHPVRLLQTLARQTGEAQSRIIGCLCRLKPRRGAPRRRGPRFPRAGLQGQLVQFVNSPLLSGRLLPPQRRGQILSGGYRQPVRQRLRPHKRGVAVGGKAPPASEFRSNAAGTLSSRTWTWSARQVGPSGPPPDRSTRSTCGVGRWGSGRVRTGGLRCVAAPSSRP